MALSGILTRVSLTVVTIYFGVTCCHGNWVTLSRGSWKGGAGFIPVERQAVQEKLDFYNTHYGQYGGPLLYLPRNHVLPDILNKSQHVLYVDLGTVTVHDCDFFKPVDRELCPTLSRIEFIVSIPLLSTDPDAEPILSLAMDAYYSRNRSDVPNIHFMHHYVPVDEVSIDGHTATIRDGNDEIMFFIELDDSQCHSSSPLIRHELQMFVEKKLELGISKPDFSLCKSLQEHQFCSADYGSISDIGPLFFPNVCQTPWISPTNATCSDCLKIFNITPGFSERLLIGNDDPVRFATSATYDQSFDVTVQFPCLFDQFNNWEHL